MAGYPDGSRDPNDHSAEWISSCTKAGYANNAGSRAALESHVETTAFDGWTGSWALDCRENWKAYLEFVGVPAQNLEIAEKAPDFHKYRLTADAFTLEHEIPAQKLHLLFRADLDDRWHPSPYPQPTVGHWAEGEAGAIPTWKNKWLECGKEFETVIPNFMGKSGKTVTIQRRLVAESQIKMTVHVHEEGKLLVGPCFTWMKKIADVGPQPLAWLRKNGKPLKTAEERVQVLEKLHQLVAENIDEISAAHDKDRVFPARFNGVAMMIMHGIRGYQKLVAPWMEPEILVDDCPPPLRAGVEAQYSVVNEPKGVCINISPWNAPVQLSLMPVMAMLAAGNHAVIKPPELVPNVSALLRRLVQKYLHGYVWVEEGNRFAVERLIDEEADHLIFTGGGEIAKHVAARCAQYLTPYTLELGGKSPVFFDKSLSEPMLDAGVREIMELKVFKTGQFCCAHDYALVHEDIYDRFLEKFKAAVESLGEKRHVPLIGRRQYEGIKRKLDDAADAARLPPLEGSYVPDEERLTVPFTLLLEPALDELVLTQEIFGPLLPVVKVKSVDEAVDLVSGPRAKPLIAYCYSENDAVVDAFQSRTTSGNLAINAGPQRMHANFNAGFGGIGPSGSGVSMWGREALREFSNRRSVIKAKNGFAQSYFSGPPKA